MGPPKKTCREEDYLPFLRLIFFNYVAATMTQYRKAGCLGEGSYRDFSFAGYLVTLLVGTSHGSLGQSAQVNVVLFQNVLGERGLPLFRRKTRNVAP